MKRFVANGVINCLMFSRDHHQMFFSLLPLGQVPTSHFMGSLLMLTKPWPINNSLNLWSYRDIDPNLGSSSHSVLRKFPKCRVMWNTVFGRADGIQNLLHLHPASKFEVNPSLLKVLRPVMYSSYQHPGVNKVELLTKLPFFFSVFYQESAI